MHLPAIESDAAKLQSGSELVAISRAQDPAAERSQLEDFHRAVLNVLEDYSAEKAGLEHGQKAFLNILADFEAEKDRLGSAQRAVLNILEDLTGDKTQLEAAQRASLNILEDMAAEKSSLQAAQQAVVNILEDSATEKRRLETTQRAVLNILEDFDGERAKVERVNQQLAKENDDRRQAEEEVQKVNAQLLTANKDLESFTYSVSHDLRAPVRHISGFSKILMDEYGASLQPEAFSYLQRVLEGAKQMGNLVDDLLKLSRVGQQELTLGRTSLTELAQDVLAPLRTEAAGRQIEWRIADLPTAECDPGLMKQVFANLLANAVKFTRMREHAIIEVGCLVQNGETIFFVRDNGVGFSMKYADKLFGIFQRLHRAEDFEGTGVGLATVQRIIHKHRGRIWAEAEVNRGATFYFTLEPARA